MGRSGRGPEEVITAVPGEAGDFGDGANFMVADNVAPSSAAARNAGKELRRSSAYGGFGVTEETHSNLRDGK